jgi:hypothetical protein
MFDVHRRPPDELCDLMFAHEVLRRLGFMPDQIHATYGHESLGITLIARRRHTWHLAPTTLTFHEFERLWADVVAAWNTAPPELGSKVWGFHKSRILACSPRIAEQLMLDGELQVLPGRGFVPTQTLLRS